MALEQDTTLHFLSLMGKNAIVQVFDLPSNSYRDGQRFFDFFAQLVAKGKSLNSRRSVYYLKLHQIGQSFLLYLATQ